ncbi:calcium-activated chloride channel regulator family member 3 [Eurytemora carolleeae]|uniref:calcium-activated chloride channel regulator family member 3 n=1 Tax=Eurytemora carolleeae TaxID=1294199 RepID=UPI000C793E8F|nr:calcium-activated chloride channel regulator family member 3 [Eurytemora carolleeae]|eukprot:XP_023322603.1 calcium-activated chloride channel regulator family member 3-like [Eurytemora affinis]
MKILHIYILQIVLLVIRNGNSMELSSSGEYTGVTVRIHEDSPVDNCQQLLDNLQDLLERTSESVGVASGGRVWPSQYIVVLPSSWSGSPCSSRGEIPRGNTRFKRDDIIISDGPLVYGAHPCTVQPKGCGEKGAYISLPLSYLRDNSSWEEERAGKLMAHQFFKLRFGLFDEQGYPDDPLYPNYYKHQGRILPTGSTNIDVKGVWLTEKGMSPCAPDNEVCVFHPQGDNDGLICSLGYLPQLEGTTRYCTPEQLNFRIPPTKQNVICGGKSAHEIIEGSEDYRLVSGTGDSNSSFVPRVDFVLSPREKIVLVLETSSSMGEDEDWKWIQKVAHKLIRYDLPSSIEVGVVSFSNESKVEYPLTKLESARGKLADSVPDKYR